MLLIFNPKAYVIISAMFAQFLVASNSIVIILWVTTIFTLNNMVVFFLWPYLGGCPRIENLMV
ncbi:MAG: threonine/homoserine/homoserine lactone efflux protein [Candidatus Endobugula sp.]|jgi:threonine/homoserine/homoserine lactone efflux protein